MNGSASGPASPTTVQIRLQKKPGAGLGFNVVGGSDQPHIPGDPGLFVSKIRRDGAAYSDGRLKEGDRIIEVNGTWMGDMEHEAAVSVLRATAGVVDLLVEPDAQQTALDRPDGFSPSSSRDSVKTVIDKGPPKGDTVDTPRSGLSMAGSVASLASAHPSASQPPPSDSDDSHKHDVPSSGSSLGFRAAEESGASVYWEAGVFLVGLAALGGLSFFAYRRFAARK